MNRIEKQEIGHVGEFLQHQRRERQAVVAISATQRGFNVRRRFRRNEQIFLQQLRQQCLDCGRYDVWCGVIATDYLRDDN